MSFSRGLDGSDPMRQEQIAAQIEQEQRRQHSRLGSGTLACPRCDAPIGLTAPQLALSAVVACPFCEHEGVVRDFLSLAQPTRPQRVEVRVVRRAPGSAR